MAATTASETNEVLKTLASPQLYKPGQGKWARNGTLLGLTVLILAGAYSWHQTYIESDVWKKLGLPILVAGGLVWVAYRVTHYPRFADFLITTEAEMTKVHWPSWKEVKASTFVVLVSILMMACFLFVVDKFWNYVLGKMGILKIQGLLRNNANMSQWFSEPMLQSFFSWFWS